MKLKFCVILILLLPQVAAAEMDEGTIMMIQEQQAESRRIDRENDRTMFGLIQQWSASQFGCDYAASYGTQQANAMFGAPVHCRSKGARNFVKMEKLPILWLPVNISQPVAKRSNALKELVFNRAIEQKPVKITKVKPTSAVQTSIAPAPQAPTLPALAPAANSTVKAARHKKMRYDPDENPDEAAYRAAHGIY